MYTKNLTVKEMYASIGSTNFIASLFKEGLAMDNDRLAVSAMEELLRRGDSDLIANYLNDAFELGQIVRGSSLITLIASSLLDGAREVDPILCRYGRGLLRGDFMSPYKWAHEHADQFQKVPKCGHDVSNWVSAHIWDDDGK